MRDRVAAGWKAKADGASFEADLERENALYAAQGFAKLTRAHPPVGGPPGHLYRKGEGGCDFVGVAYGIPILFDAKTRTGAASYKHDDRDAHQLEELLDFYRARGLVFLLIRDPTLHRIYLLGIAEIVRLHRGETVRLRRDKDAPHLPTLAEVPCRHRSPSEQIAALAASRPLWGWLDLLAEASEPFRLARAAFRPMPAPARGV